MFRRLMRAPLAWVAVVAVVAVAAVGLFWFQPWKLFTSSEVRDEIPVVAIPAPASGAPGSTGADGAGSDGPGGSDTPGDGATAPNGNVLLSMGSFVTQEHKTTGDVQLVRLKDGKLQLVFRGLDTSDGPDLRVWLSDQPVDRGRDGWKVFDDGIWVELGKLKGTKGDQVYDVPASADLDQLRSVSIWCKRFSVSFGAAQLRAV